MLIFNAWDGFANFLLTQGDTFVRIQLKLLLEVTQLSHASPFIFCPSGIIIQCKIQMGGEQWKFDRQRRDNGIWMHEWRKTNRFYLINDFFEINFTHFSRGWSEEVPLWGNSGLGRIPKRPPSTPLSPPCSSQSISWLVLKTQPPPVLPPSFWFTNWRLYQGRRHVTYYWSAAAPHGVGFGKLWTRGLKRLRRSPEVVLSWSTLACRRTAFDCL